MQIKSSWITSEWWSSEQSLSNPCGNKPVFIFEAGSLQTVLVILYKKTMSARLGWHLSGHMAEATWGQSS